MELFKGKPKNKMNNRKERDTYGGHPFWYVQHDPAEKNLDTFETEEPLTQQEWEGLLALAKEMTNPKALTCTS